jgi:hypothetical protein
MLRKAILFELRNTILEQKKSDFLNIVSQLRNPIFEKIGFLKPLVDLEAECVT